MKAALTPLGPLGTLDRAFALVREAGGQWLLRPIAGGLLVAAVVLGAYYVERVEGVRALRPILAFALVLAFWGRSLLMAGAARAAVQRLWPGAVVDERAGEPLAVLRTASVLAVGLWCWSWVLVGASLFGPFGVVAALPLLALRGAVAPSWIARAGVAPGGGIRASFAALSDTSGRRAMGVTVELLVLLGAIGLAMNLYGVVMFVLLLGRSMLGLDLALVDSFLGTGNTFVLLSVGAATLVLLEPLRAALSATYYVDARVQTEGLDLRAAVDDAIRAAGRRVGDAPPSDDQAPAPRASARSAAALVLVASGLALWASSPAVAQPPPAELSPLPPGTGPDGVAPEADPSSWDPTGTGMPPKDPDAFDSTGLFDAPEGVDPESLPAAVPDAGDDRVREKVAEILARPEFEEFADGRGEGVRQAIERFLAWLFRPRETPDMNLGTGVAIPMPPASVFLVLGALLLIGIIAYLAATRVRGQRAATAGAGAAAGVPVDPRDRAPEAHLDDAAVLASRGKYREALRSLYVATLVALDRRRVIAFDPALTNWQYIRQMPRGEQRADFSSFTRLFDYKWYGDEPTTESDYLRCRDLAARIVGAHDRGQEAA